ncbi:hypothetical protein LSAT2_008953 [Lamellibrachia satsuma]|nr:hypothetical protein LSAT2_008953 [Lamellibrachia satsuma]
MHVDVKHTSASLKERNTKSLYTTKYCFCQRFVSVDMCRKPQDKDDEIGVLTTYMPTSSAVMSPENWVTASQVRESHSLTGPWQSQPHRSVAVTASQVRGSHITRSVTVTAHAVTASQVRGSHSFTVTASQVRGSHSLTGPWQSQPHRSVTVTVTQLYGSHSLTGPWQSQSYSSLAVTASQVRDSHSLTALWQSQPHKSVAVTVLQL